MRKAIILAAGMGWRLGSGYPPKSLFEFGGKSLLQRHVELLSQCGVEEIVVGVGYRHHLIEAELSRCPDGPLIRTVLNEDYRLGNIVTLWKLRDEVDCGEDVLLMDADVLYDARLLRRLIESPNSSCLLIDRNCDPGDEPVKVCVEGERIVEFGKLIDPAIAYDFHGESVGFFKLSEDVARRLLRTVEGFIAREDLEALYEEAIREMLLNDPLAALGFEEVTSLPWTEIDFHSDLERARRDVLPRMQEMQDKAGYDAA